MTVLADCHMHSSFSGDSDSPMNEMIKSAIAKGLHDICFTEHMDLDYPTQKDDPEGEPAGCFEVDMPRYKECIDKMRHKYMEKINIGIGLEFGLQAGLEDRYRKLASSYEFDFIIASTHLCRHKDIPWKSFWELGSEDELFRSYFNESLDNLRNFTNFDVYGHLDYVVRYAPNKDKNYSYSKYSDVIDEILRQIISEGKGIEINTKGKRSGLCEMNPCSDILKRYRELGGEIITIGSDAHKPSDIGALVNTAGQILSSCGFRYYSVFKGHRPVMYKLES